MLQWKARFALLLAALATIASFVGTELASFEWLQLGW